MTVRNTPSTSTDRTALADALRTRQRVARRQSTRPIPVIGGYRVETDTAGRLVITHPHSGQRWLVATPEPPPTPAAPQPAPETGGQPAVAAGPPGADRVPVEAPASPLPRLS